MSSRTIGIGLVLLLGLGGFLQYQAKFNRDQATGAAAALFAVGPEARNPGDKPRPKPSPLLPFGSEAPDFELPGLDGELLKLSSLRGRIVLLDFWASWCAPCRVALSELRDLKPGELPEGVEILCINVKEELDQVLRFHAVTPVPGRILLDVDAAVARKYLVWGIPTHYLVDREGKIALAFTGFTSWSLSQIVNKAREIAEQPRTDHDGRR